MYSQFSAANRLPVSDKFVGKIRLLAEETTEQEWDFMMESPGEEGVFNSLIETVKDIGASGYELMLTIGIIGLVFSIILTVIALVMTNNAQKKEEKKSHALIIFIAGVVLFSVFNIIGFFKAIGAGL